MMFFCCDKGSLFFSFGRLIRPPFPLFLLGGIAHAATAQGAIPPSKKELHSGRGAGTRFITNISPHTPSRC
jgi:hypothetical protein